MAFGPTQPRLKTYKRMFVCLVWLGRAGVWSLGAEKKERVRDYNVNRTYREPIPDKLIFRYGGACNAYATRKLSQPKTGMQGLA